MMFLKIVHMLSGVTRSSNLAPLLFLLFPVASYHFFVDVTFRLCFAIWTSDVPPLTSRHLSMSRDMFAIDGIEGTAAGL